MGKGGRKQALNACDVGLFSQATRGAGEKGGGQRSVLEDLENLAHIVYSEEAVQMLPDCECLPLALS